MELKHHVDKGMSVSMGGLGGRYAICDGKGKLLKIQWDNRLYAEPMRGREPIEAILSTSNL